MGSRRQRDNDVNDAELKLVSLRECEPREFPGGTIDAEIGESIWREYGRQVAVEFPSPKTGGKGRLTSQGWIGQIPLTSELRLVLQPKVSLGNVFRMLDYAYRLDKSGLAFPKGLVDSGSLTDFFERLASVLAKRVLDRGRKGFYRAYRHEEERLSYLRGRLDVHAHLRNPWEPRLPCHYDEHSADVTDNQLLSWTLSRVARSGICQRQAQATVRRAYRSLQGFATLTPFTPQECVGRLYHRLNVDYQPMHVLCRFFLEHTGPTHRPGDKEMIPFLIDMNRLFELFVAEWLKAHLSSDFHLRDQQRVTFSGSDTLHFQIDLVLFESGSGQPVAVIDTKYKSVTSPSADDVAQVVAYAESTGCHDAVLVYPMAGDLDAAGRELVSAILFDTGEE